MNRLDHIDAHRVSWWHDCNELSALYSYLVDTDQLDYKDPGAVAYMLSRPWKYHREYREMRAESATDLEHRLNASLAIPK